jgi:hypothetical protein
MPFRNNDKDWLLTVSKVLLIFAEIGFVFGLIGIVIGIIAHLTFAREKVFAALASAGAPDGTYIALVAMLALVWLTLSLSMLFVRQLRGVIDSVGRGDPFEPANADRLTRMAWYALGVQACQFAIEPILTTYGRYATTIGGSDGITSASDASLTALALAVTLFILARVFRYGAAMRSDLEGTV